MRWVVFYSMFCFLASCASSEPCDYDIVETRAKIVTIESDTQNPGIYKIGMQFYGSSLSDKIHYLDEFKENKMDSTFLAKNKIKKGYEYEVTVSDLLSGSCDKLVVSFNHRFK